MSEDKKTELGFGLEALYDKLILRDLAGKIAPGALVLLAATAALTSPEKAIKDWETIPVPGWLLLVAVAWLAGCAIQGLGEFTARIPRLSLPIRYHPKSYTREQWYELQSTFDELANEQQHQARERFFVLAHATGNSCLALVLSILIMLPGALSRVPLVIVFTAVAAFGLWKTHNESVDRSASYAETVVTRLKGKGQNTG